MRPIFSVYYETYGQRFESRNEGAATQCNRKSASVIRQHRGSAPAADPMAQGVRSTVRQHLLALTRLTPSGRTGGAWLQYITSDLGVAVRHAQA